MVDIIRGPDNRVHILTGQDWVRYAGTDFWLSVGDTVLGATNHALCDNSWTTTGLAPTAADGSADFLSSSDVGNPNRIRFNSASDLINSPELFGDYNHATQAAQFLGYQPTKLNLEVQARFPVHSANETTTGFGLIDGGGTPGTEADHVAFIHTDNANFTLRSSADSDVGAADGTLLHRFKVTVAEGTTDAIEWFIDGTSQGTIDNREDAWPCSFGGYTSTTNRIDLMWVHIWYS